MAMSESGKHTNPALRHGMSLVASREFQTLPLPNENTASHGVKPFYFGHSFLEYHNLSTYQARALADIFVWDMYTSLYRRIPPGLEDRTQPKSQYALIFVEILKDHKTATEITYYIQRSMNKDPNIFETAISAYILTTMHQGQSLVEDSSHQAANTKKTHQLLNENQAKKAGQLIQSSSVRELSPHDGCSMASAHQPTAPTAFAVTQHQPQTTPNRNLSTSESAQSHALRGSSKPPGLSKSAANERRLADRMEGDEGIDNPIPCQTCILRGQTCRIFRAVGSSTRCAACARSQGAARHCTAIEYYKRHGLNSKP